MDSSQPTRLIMAGVVVAFALLIGAVWASDVSAATGLAMTGVIVLVGVGILAMISPARRVGDQAEAQRDRMRNTTP